MEILLEATLEPIKFEKYFLQFISTQTKMTTEKIEAPIDPYYNMNHKNRGVTLIFNHEEFDDSTLSVREGTQKDCEKLRETFAALNFDVRVHNDKRKSQMKSILEKSKFFQKFKFIFL